MHSKRRFSTMSKSEMDDSRKKRVVPLKLFLQAFFLASVFVVVLAICLVLAVFVDQTSEEVASKMAVKQSSNIVQQVQYVLAPYATSVSALGAHTKMMLDSETSRFGFCSKDSVLSMLFQNLLTSYQASSFSYLLVCMRKELIDKNATRGTFLAVVLDSNGFHVMEKGSNQTLILQHASLTSQCLRGKCELGPREEINAGSISSFSLNATLHLWDDLSNQNFDLFRYASDRCEVTVTNLRQYNGFSVGGVWRWKEGFRGVFLNNRSFPSTSFVMDVKTHVILASSAPNATEDAHEPDAWIKSVLPVSVLSELTGLSVVTRISIEDVQSDVKEGTRLMIMLSVTIAVAVAAAGSLFVHVFVRPMVHLCQDMRKVGKLEVGGLTRRPTVIRELDGIAKLLVHLSFQVSKVQQMLQKEDEGLTSLNGTLNTTNVTFDDTMKLAFEESLAIRTTQVTVEFESRKTSKSRAKATFDFVYASESENDLLQRLMSECRMAVDEDEFEEVTLTYVNEANEYVLLNNTMQCEEIFAASPKEVKLVMYRANWPMYNMLLTTGADLLNAVVTVVYASKLLSHVETKNSAIAFICFYLFALCINCAITLHLVRSGSEDFIRWMQKKHAEFNACLILSSLNTQNLQIAFSYIRIGKWLRFNSPMDSKLLQSAISWSVFGFLFSDVAQLMFKIWQVYNSPRVDPLYFVALSTSAISVAFNLVFKLHAMLLWHNTADPLSLATEHVAEEGQVVAKEITLVMTEFTLPAYVRQLQLRAVELNAFYDTVITASKQYKGTVLKLHGGQVLTVFNVPRKTASHSIDAFSFAAHIANAAESKGQKVTSCVHCGVYPVGMLGTLNNKILHCFAPLYSMQRIINIGMFADVHLLCTTTEVTALGWTTKTPVRLQQRTLSTYERRCGSVKEETQYSVYIPRLLLSQHQNAGWSLLEYNIRVLTFQRSVDSLDLRLAQLAAALGFNYCDHQQLEDRVYRLVQRFNAWQRKQSHFEAGCGYGQSLSPSQILPGLRVKSSG